MNNVNYSGVAVKDLNDIQTFLNNKSVAYAKHIVEGLKNAIANLKNFRKWAGRFLLSNTKTFDRYCFTRTGLCIIISPIPLPLLRFNIKPGRLKIFLN